MVDDTSTDPETNENSTMAETPQRFETTATAGMVPAAWWECPNCHARGFTLKAQIIETLAKGDVVEDTCGKCGSALVVRRALVSTLNTGPNRHQRRAQIALAGK